ncbi:membrane protein insertion efficiency factor YidD [Allorhizobium sp. BGMRC 0089]|uniref:membrane protein insertion efficiency factor YidD n=1 Tax=Allorhizobium sonneratiae TaxID=2934936 RepID=UPI0020348A5F|nr:membrane protein insertion efficiency factor YidD [Allorhizobium sonneratiae]MCM2292876.1 membrane protein insertion efficiency factor YidD [Allorhizobium sonneratiae]
MCLLCERDDEEDGGAAPSRSVRLRYRHDVGTDTPKATSRNYDGPFRKTPGRLLAMGFIRLYQLTFSSLIGNACRHMPTCSEYGYEAIARHGLWSGGWLTLFRVGRCGPGGTWGVDPVPQSLGEDYRFWQVWRLIRFGRKRA